MCFISDYTTSDPPVRGNNPPIGYELESESMPARDTIPCPPPDWEELELELE
jgi:hypothetical protein